MPRISLDEKVALPPKEPVAVPASLSLDDELRAKSGGAVASSFCAFPVGVRFAGEHSGENIILLLRAHRVTNIPWVLIALVLAVLPIAVVPAAVVSGIFPIVGAGLTTMILLLWYLGLFTYSFVNALYWYFNVGIITNERMVDVDWNSVTHRDVATAAFRQVQDVREEQVGVLAGIFDFGNVFAQTAGNDPNIEFLRVPHPQLVMRKIQQLIAQHG